MERIFNIIPGPQEDPAASCCTASFIAGKDDETAPATVSFGGQEHPLVAMKVALEAVGVAVAKNAGVPAVTKALDALTEEQTAALVEALAAKEE